MPWVQVRRGRPATKRCLERPIAFCPRGMASRPTRCTLFCTFARLRPWLRWAWRCTQEPRVCRGEESAKRRTTIKSMPPGPQSAAAGSSTAPPLTHPALGWAHPLVQEWFLAKFGSPTEPQTAGWPAILRGETVLISAPTGSGKTLAAFLVCIDGLLRASLEGRLSPHTHVVYVSPLKALSNDVQKNLDAPLAEIQQLALQRGYLCPEIRTAVRTGDTLTKDRVAMLRTPPHILVTTPESLYILLTAGKSRQMLSRVSTVIV